MVFESRYRQVPSLVVRPARSRSRFAARQAGANPIPARVTGRYRLQCSGQQRRQQLQCVPRPCYPAFVTRGTIACDQSPEEQVPAPEHEQHRRGKRAHHRHQLRSLSPKSMRASQSRRRVHARSGSNAPRQLWRSAIGIATFLRDYADLQLHRSRIHRTGQRCRAAGHHRSEGLRLATVQLSAWPKSSTSPTAVCRRVRKQYGMLRDAWNSTRHPPRRSTNALEFRGGSGGAIAKIARWLLWRGAGRR